jgi:hypothetical protein
VDRGGAPGDATNSTERELVELSKRGGPQRHGAFDAATAIRQLLRDADRDDTVGTFLVVLDRALLKVDDLELQEVGRAAFRRPPYRDRLLEDRLDKCALVLAQRKGEESGRLVLAASLKTMSRRRKELIELLPPLLRQAAQSEQRSADTGDDGQVREERPIAGDASEWGREVSVPDGTLVQPGEVFNKSWELRNAGTVPWHGRFLSRLGASEGDDVPQSPARVPIPDTEPGESVTISVPVRAPESPGEYQVHWKMTDQHGRQYFPSDEMYWGGIWLRIVVPGTH